MIWFPGYLYLFFAVLATVLFCAFAWWRRLLTASASFAALITGVIILLAGGWLLALPMILFFIAGSGLSKLPSKALTHDRKSKTPRDAVQVICNGGIAAICALLFILFKCQIFIICYFVSIAVSMSDTASSEAGNYFKGRVVDIVSWKPVQKGLSGGVSVTGTAAGAAGAFVIAFLYFITYSYSYGEALVIFVAGFAGMLLDSVFGSLLQAKYMGEDKNIVDAPVAGAKLFKGIVWVTNDAVNFVSNLVATVLVFAMLLLT